MNQSKLESMIEVSCNYISGFIIAYLTYDLIVIPNPWLKESPFWVTTLFTFVSIIRTYLWRRFFNTELHITVHKLINRLIK